MSILSAIIKSMKTSLFLRRLVSFEYVFAAVLTALFFVEIGKFDWWWLIVLFPLVDVSAFGYLQNSRAGALTYNLGHSLIGPAILITLYVIYFNNWLLFAGLVWLFHIFIDRALGYGLKHSEGFGHTHLGSIGKAKQPKRKR